MKFSATNQPAHDRSASGRKGKAASPWRKGNMRTKGSARLREEWKLKPDSHHRSLP